MGAGVDPSRSCARPIRLTWWLHLAAASAAGVDATDTLGASGERQAGWITNQPPLSLGLADRNARTAGTSRRIPAVRRVWRWLAVSVWRVDGHGSSSRLSVRIGHAHRSEHATARRSSPCPIIHHGFMVWGSKGPRNGIKCVRTRGRSKRVRAAPYSQPTWGIPCTERAALRQPRDTAMSRRRRHHAPRHWSALGTLAHRGMSTRLRVEKAGEDPSPPLRRTDAA